MKFDAPYFIQTVFSTGAELFSLLPLSSCVLAFLTGLFPKWGSLEGEFRWDVQEQFHMWSITTEFLQDLPIVAERDFVITKGL